MASNWLFTGSPENYAATAARGYSLIGLKERNRNRALQIEPGDRIILYATGVMAFAGSIRVEGDMFEDRAPVWPGKPGRPDAYPWRFPTSPDIILAEDRWVPARALAGELDHVAKWPREHWTLAFQGQIRAISDHDAEVILERLAAAGAGAAATARTAATSATPATAATAQAAALAATVTP